jgi:hypothetical protein
MKTCVHTVIYKKYICTYNIIIFLVLLHNGAIKRKKEKEKQQIEKPMSAQIAQRFAAIDRRSNGSHRVSLVYKLHPTLTLSPSPSSRSLSSPFAPL